MKLTDRILLHHLQDHFVILDTQNTGKSGYLEGILFYEEDQEACPGWVYICGNGRVPPPGWETESMFLVLTEGIMDPEDPGSADDGKKRAFRCSAVVIRKAREAAILRILMQTFRFYEMWGESLDKIQLGFGSAEEMLKRSVEIFSNPMVIFRNDMTVRTFVSRVDLSSVSPLFEPGREQMEMLNALMQNEEFRRNRQNQTPYWGPDYITGFRALHCNIQKMGDTSYSLALLEIERPVTEADKDLLPVLCSYVENVIYGNDRGLNRQNENLQKTLTNILSDRTLDYMEASRELTELGWQRDHAYVCLVFRLTYLDQNSLPVNSICNYMDEQFSGCCSFSFREEIVNFIDLTLCQEDLDRIETRLKPFIRDSYLKAGYSRVVTGHLNLRRQYVQAGLSLDVGSRKNPYLWIHHFDAVAIPYILEQITRKLPGQMLSHEGLLRLRDHDRENGTQYMETLKTYLDHQENAVQSAKTLFIHRSTFLYRMEKIREIMDSDLEDPDELLYINLSFRLLEQEE